MSQSVGDEASGADATRNHVDDNPFRDAPSDASADASTHNAQSAVSGASGYSVPSKDVEMRDAQDDPLQAEAPAPEEDRRDEQGDVVMKDVSSGEPPGPAVGEEEEEEDLPDMGGETAPDQADEDGDAPMTNHVGESSTPGEEDEKGDSVPRFGCDDEGKPFPGFEAVKDDYLSFNSDSDHTIFNRQISSEIPLQRLVAVKRLGSSCPRFGSEASFQLINRIRNVAGDKEMVIRQTTAEQLGPYAKYLIESTQNSERAHKLIIEELLPLLKEMLRDAMEVRQASGTSLIMIAELLTKEEVYEHVLKIVLHMAHDDTDDQKISALPLLGDLAPIVGRQVCRNYLSSDLHALSQDNSFRVRKATVQYFGPICEQLGADDAERTLLPIFKQLCQDSIWSVRKGCVESFVNVSSSIHQETRGTLLPLMEQLLTDSSRWVRNTAYEQLGPFIATLKSEQVTDSFLKYYANIPHLSSAEADADCTNHCAFNFPAVALTLGRGRWKELNDTYNVLVRKTFKSRKTLACSIHEICEILGTEMTEEYLMNAIEFFLKDIDDIREGIIKNLWKILKVLGETKRTEHLATLWELGSESDVNWRFRLLLAEQLDEITTLYKPEQVAEQIMPLAFQLCDDRMAGVRYAAVRTVAELIDFFDVDDAKDYFDEVLSKCHQIHAARTYSKRLLFVKLAGACLDRVTPAVFEEHFLPKLLEYGEDRIANVRLALATILHLKILKNEAYAARPDCQECIEKLRKDPEDVEVRRFFSTHQELESFLQELKERDPPAEVQPATVNKTQGGGQDMEESESTIYTSSDDDMDDSDDGPKDAKELEALNRFDVEKDQIQKEVSEEDQTASRENAQRYAESKAANQEFNTALIHSRTPYRLPHVGTGSDSDSDEDDTPKNDEKADDLSKSPAEANGDGPSAEPQGSAEKEEPSDSDGLQKSDINEAKDDLLETSGDLPAANAVDAQEPPKDESVASEEPAPPDSQVTDAEVEASDPPPEASSAESSDSNPPAQDIAAQPNQ